MSYRIEAGETVQQAARRIAAEQIDKAIDELNDESLDRNEAVHQVRKRFKKIRGLLRLLRDSLGGAYSRENAWFRDLGRELSAMRDAEAMIETLDGIRGAFEDQLDLNAFSSVRAALERRRAHLAEQEVDLDARTAELAEQLAGAGRRVRQWKLSKKGFAAVAGGLARTYARGRRAVEDAYDQGGAEAFHELRKRVKYHGYQVRLLRRTWSPMMKARQDALNKLADLLGDAHDLAVFETMLRRGGEELGDPAEVQALLALAEYRQALCRADARRPVLRVFAEKPKAFVGRVGRYWDAWTEEPLAPAPPRAFAPASA